MADPLPVVPARENLRTVVESNTIGGRVSGDETVSIDSLFGDISTSQRAQDTVADIMSQMSGPKGYVERLIVDQDGKVIEGAHRLEALRRLGISEVPITRIVDPTANLDLSSMRKAIEGAGKIPSDHVNQIMSQVGEMLTSTGNSPEKVLEEYTFPEGYEKYFGAALDSVADEPPPTDQPRLPLLLPPPGEPGKKPSKGSIFRGIGSLMRGRIFPLMQAAQAGWGALSPEARAEVEAFLERPAHELVGMDKPGIEYFKEWLGISPEDLGETPSETIPLSDLQKYIATYHGGPSEWAPEPGYPEGRPRLEMVGTGEGAAAYGHGFYSAEAKGVARTYQDGLGAFYKIDIPEADAANLLDWDAPLSGQSAGVREAFQKAFEGAGIPDAAKMNPDGESAYTWLAAAQSRGESVSDAVLKQRASEALGRAGIPGLKYYDQMSRRVRDNQFQVSGGKQPMAFSTREAAEAHVKVNGGMINDAGQGTRNYVIWDQGLLDQLRTVRKEAAGGFIDKPLYEEARVGGLI